MALIKTQITDKDIQSAKALRKVKRLLKKAELHCKLIEEGFKKIKDDEGTFI